MLYRLLRSVIIGLGIVLLGVLTANTVHAQTWRRGQQLLIWPRPTTMQQLDTLVLTGLARTSSGVPIAAPKVSWNISPVEKASGTSLGANPSNRLQLIAQQDTGAIRIIGRWVTSNATFYDTLFTRIERRPGALVWRKGQQLQITATDTVIRTPGDSVVATVYARTSSGVPVAMPGITWRATNINGVEINNAVKLRVVITGRQGMYDMRAFLVASWTTSSGTFRDSVVYRTVGPSTFPNLAPFTSFALDTVNIFTPPGSTQLRPGIAYIGSPGDMGPDSSRVNYGETVVYRLDPNPNAASRYYPVRVVQVIQSVLPPDSVAKFAYVISRQPLCPIANANSGMGVRWRPENPLVNTNITTTLSMALAAAAQMPVSMMEEMARYSLQQYAIRDPNDVGSVWHYERCYGPLAPTTGQVMWPLTRVPLDTINTFHLPSGQLRPGVAFVDSSTFATYSYEMYVTRVDSTGKQYRFNLSPMYINQSTPEAVYAGHIISLATGRECTTGDPRGDKSFWGIPWYPSFDLPPYPIAREAKSARLVQAAVAQLPIETLRSLGTHAAKVYLNSPQGRDYTNGKIWYEWCYGPITN